MLKFTNIFAAIVVFCFAAAPVLASEAPKADSHAKTDSHAKADSHAPAKKDPIAFTGYQRWDLAIYSIIVFLLVLFILSKYAFPNIVEGLKKREALISQAKDDAIAAQKETEALRVKLAAEFSEANDKIRALLEEARRDADALRIKEREIGQKEAMAERERAKREIEAAKDAALNEIYQKSVDLATLISTKAVRKSMSADDHRRLVDEALADLKNGRI